MSKARRIGLSQGATDGWNVFEANGALVARFDDFDSAASLASELGWTPERTRRIHAPWLRESSLGPRSAPNAIASALEAWRRAEAAAEAQDPGCDPREREEAREAVRRARKRWEEAALADRRTLF
jgi:hypothetical protein